VVVAESRDVLTGAVPPLIVTVVLARAVPQMLAVEEVKYGAEGGVKVGGASTVEVSLVAGVPTNAGGELPPLVVYTTLTVIGPSPSEQALTPDRT
jgi:hypothetical protein